ncbi:conserved hypothetical protein [Ricinus communis]|uniref:HTH myb-type domain-containing protein n=1 Tax=Ricinus communis TaxID=3988 RepID=B9RB28_RICCO|nr:conserved hypothetical protein [Ricinus communis]
MDKYSTPPLTYEQWSSGLRRCGKSCRLRWVNYLSPSIKHDNFSEQEEDLIIRLHNLLGNSFRVMDYIQSGIYILLEIIGTIASGA